MKPNKHMQEVLDAYAALGAPPLETVSPEAARQLPTLADAAHAVIGQHATNRILTSFPEPVADVSHRVIPGPGGELLVRLYTPEGTGPFPVLVYFHGGGWVIATLNTYDDSCRALANGAQSIVVSVAYRQAPEHKFPAAVEDAYAAFQWTLLNAASFQGDPQRVAVGGESAGGNLAAVVSQIARDRGETLPIHQLLVYPVTDFTFESPSYHEHADAKPLNRAMMHWFARHYLPTQAAAENPYAAPLRARDFSGLPPATVITAEIDPLCSEGEAYAERLRQAGVPVEARRFSGVAHEFFGMKALLDESKEALSFAADQLKSARNLSVLHTGPGR